MALRVIDGAEAFRKEMDAERDGGLRVGLVPTMGALHAGHLSLMERAADECDVVAATLFVNPLQFRPGEDLDSYPRDLKGDRALAEAAGVAYLFAPSRHEMFPEPPVTTVTVAGFSDVLEGKWRPGHFPGVATIVTKLLSLAGPCRAYFGEKDFQQLAVIRRLVRDLSLAADVVGCPTIRDADGLALSSRNRYLTPEERAVAPTLYQALLRGRAAATELRSDDGRGAAAGAEDGRRAAAGAENGRGAAAGAEDGRRAAAGAENGRGAAARADDVRAAMAETVARQPSIYLEYADIVDPSDLTPLTTVDRDARLLIAARLGRTRLIDNLAVERAR